MNFDANHNNTIDSLIPKILTEIENAANLAKTYFLLPNDFSKWEDPSTMNKLAKTASYYCPTGGKSCVATIAMNVTYDWPIHFLDLVAPIQNAIEYANQIYAQFNPNDPPSSLSPVQNEYLKTTFTKYFPTIFQFYAKSPSTDFFDDAVTLTDFINNCLKAYQNISYFSLFFTYFQLVFTPELTDVCSNTDDSHVSKTLNALIEITALPLTVDSNWASMNIDNLLSQLANACPAGSHCGCVEEAGKRITQDWNVSFNEFMNPFITVMKHAKEVYSNITNYPVEVNCPFLTKEFLQDSFVKQFPNVEGAFPYDYENNCFFTSNGLDSYKPFIESAVNNISNPEGFFWSLFGKFALFLGNINLPTLYKPPSINTISTTSTNTDTTPCNDTLKGYAQDLLNGINAIETLGQKASTTEWMNSYLTDAYTCLFKTPGFPHTTQKEIDTSITKCMSTTNPNPSYQEMIDTTTTFIHTIYAITTWIDNEGAIIGCDEDVHLYVRTTLTQLNSLIHKMNLSYDADANSYAIDSNGSYWLTWLTISIYIYKAKPGLATMAKNIAYSIINNKIPTTDESNRASTTPCNDTLKGYAQDLLNGINAMKALGPKAYSSEWNNNWLVTAVGCIEQTPGYPDNMKQSDIDATLNQCMASSNPNPSYNEMIQTTTDLMKPIYQIKDLVSNDPVLIGCNQDVRDYLREAVVNLNGLTDKACLFYDPSANSYSLDKTCPQLATWPIWMNWSVWLTISMFIYDAKPGDDLTHLLPTAETLACAILNNKVPDNTTITDAE